MVEADISTIIFGDNQIPFGLKVYNFLTLIGNLGLITLIYLHSHLHTGMYFFVGSLSFLDVCYSTVYTPLFLYDCLSKNNHISLASCAAQFSFSAGFCCSECFLVAFMAYDHFVAICNPLLYTIAMPQKLCVQLHIPVTFCLHFYGNNIINHYFCDVPPLVKMSCNDTRVYEVFLTAVIGFSMLAATAVIVKSYVGIVVAIIRIRSAAERRKAFSTCSAHLVSVSLFYGSMLIIYSTPKSYHTPNWDKTNALFYTVVNPLINPLIYSLRNKDVKAAFKKVWGRFRAPNSFFRVA